MTNLKQALTLQNIPEITQAILNLAEFMEHCEQATVSSGQWGVNPGQWGVNPGQWGVSLE